MSTVTRILAAADTVSALSLRPGQCRSAHCELPVGRSKYEEAPVRPCIIRKALTATGVAAVLLPTGSQALAQTRPMPRSGPSGNQFRINPTYTPPTYVAPKPYFPPVFPTYKTPGFFPPYGPVYKPPVFYPPYWGGWFPTYPTYPSYPVWGGGFWGWNSSWFYPKPSWWFGW